MRCNNCQAEIPNDSTFCPSCGSKIVVEVHNIQSPHIQENSRRFQQAPDASSAINGSASTVQKNNTGLIVALVLLIIVSLILGTFLYQKSEELSTLEGKYNTLDDKYDALQGKYDIAKEKAKKYDKLIKPLIKNTSDGFSASEYVFVMSPKQETTLDLTTIFSNQDKDEFNTISMNQNGYSAKIEFTEDEWSFGTTLKITAVQVGTTTVHFTNTVDSKSFDIIIFVTN